MVKPGYRKTTCQVRFKGQPNSGGGLSGSDISVDPYTGSAQASFQLYQFQSKSTGLRHSVGLSYTGGGGIRTDDIASNVGLGWVLNAALSVTREIVGRPDDGPQGFESTASSMFANNDSARYRRITSSIEDAELDRYSYATAAGGGSFVIGKNGAIVPIPLTQTKIQRLTGGSGYYFKITETDGTQYIYDVLSKTEIDYKVGASHNTTATTTWYISKIISPFAEDTIYFSYTPTTLSYDASFSSVRYVLTNPYDPDGLGTFEHNTNNRVTIQDQRLSQINYPNGDQVSLVYDAFKRLDLNSDHALNNVQISNSLSQSQYSFKFRYSYINVRDTSGVRLEFLPYQDYELSTRWNLENYCRLRLDNFHVQQGGDSLPGYRFQYEARDGQNRRTHLPARGTDRTDDWGFASPGGSRIDTTKYADPYYGRADILTGITLPSGGAFHFNYELHTAHDGTSDFNVGGVRVRTLTRSDSTGQANNQVTEYKYVKKNSSNVTISSGVTGPAAIRSSQYAEGDMPLTYSPNPGPTGPGQPYDYYYYDLVGYYALSSMSPNTSYYYNVRFGSPLNSMQYFHGAPVGYTTVEEYTGTSQRFKHKRVYNFSTVVQSGTGNYPYTPKQNIDYQNGLVLSVTDYNAAGVQMKKVVNDYTTEYRPLDDDNFVSARAAVISHPIGIIGTYVKRNYGSSTGRSYLTTTTETEYYEGDSTVSQRHIEYDTAHMVPRTISTTDAKGVPLFMKHYYPFDFAISGALATLNSRGLVYSPVRTELSRKGYPTIDALSSTYYDDIINAAVSTYSEINGIVRQSASHAITTGNPVSASSYPSFSSVQLIPPGQPFKELVHMDAYDNKSNVTQLTEKNVTSAKIWDYKRSLPIAEVENAHLSDVAYTSFEADGLGGWNFIGSGSLTTSNLNFYTGAKSISLQSGQRLSKSALNAAMSYTLSCWSRNGAPLGTVHVSLPGGGVSSSSLLFTTSETHNGWTLYKATVSGASAVEIGPSGFSAHLIDELRLHPVAAQMTTYTYDPLFGVTSVCDPANHAAHTQYDKFGRLLHQLDQDRNIIKAYQYKSADPQY